jgi:inorganic pyrophosphatase
VTESIDVVVEIPRGSRNKYEYDHEHHVIRLDRRLFTATAYPADYGFIPETLGGDGDPLDALICVSEPTFPGCVIPAKAVALLRMCDATSEDDKIVCVPVYDPGWSHVEDVDDLPQGLRDEIAHFFAVYKELEGETVEVEDWHPRATALEVIDDARRRHAERARAAEA